METATEERDELESEDEMNGIAGPTRPREDTIHIRHRPFHDISRESDEEENWVDNQLRESDVDYEEPPEKRSKLNHHTDIKLAAYVKPTSTRSIDMVPNQNLRKRVKKRKGQRKTGTSWKARMK